MLLISEKGEYMQSVFSQIKAFDNSNIQFKEGESFEFTLKPQRVQQQAEPVRERNVNRDNCPTAGDNKEYKIQVKKYMTEKATPQFDFMANWNNDIPMPFVIMSGTIEKETRGMYYMKLHGRAEKTSVCMCCGRRLTHKVSMLYGLGPECGQHAYINPFDSEEELDKHIEEVYQKISEVKWEGWIIKSAIKSMEHIKED